MNACYRNVGEKWVRILDKGEDPGPDETFFTIRSNDEGPPGPPGPPGVSSEGYSLTVRGHRILEARISLNTRTLIGRLVVPMGAYMVFARAEVLWDVGSTDGGPVNPNEAVRLWLSSPDPPRSEIDTVQEGRSPAESMDVLTLMGSVEGRQDPFRIQLEGATAQVNCGVGSAVLHAVRVSRLVRGFG